MSDNELQLVGYNLWYIPQSRWTTNYCSIVQQTQNPEDPFLLTLDQCKLWQSRMGRPWKFEVRPIMRSPNWKEQLEDQKRRQAYADKYL